MSEVKVNFNFNRELWEEFKQKAQEDQTNATDLLKMFIIRFIRGDIERSFTVKQTSNKTEEAQSSSD